MSLESTLDTEGSVALESADVDTAITEIAVEAVDDRRHQRTWTQIVVFVVLPIIVVVAAGAVGYLRWQQWSLSAADSVRGESVQAAKDATVAILSYRPETVEKDLATAQSKLTGKFRDSYASLTKDVVIPGSKKKQISAEASVPAAAPVSTASDHAVVLVYVNQILVVGNEAPTSSMSSVRVTLERIHGQWLVSGFDPV
jgi:Mce-associated membrane protein